MTGPIKISFLISEKEAGQRLDASISEKFPVCSRSFAAKLIRSGIIRVDNEIKKPAYCVRPGQKICGLVPEPTPVCFEPEPIPIDILYEDSHIIVINKKPGMVVHPAPGHITGTLVNALLHHCPDLGGIGGELRPGIVHRLDKDTSGILVVAKNAASMAHLSSQFKSRSVTKRYLAIVHGIPDKNSDIIDMPIGRHPGDRKKMSTLSKRGKNAVTHWKIKKYFSETALVDIDLKTGRTHQIRVHFAAIRHPVVGDRVYCKASYLKNHAKKIRDLLAPVSRQMLHAHKIGFIHPHTENLIEIKAPLPPDMEKMINSLSEIKKPDF